MTLSRPASRLVLVGVFLCTVLGLGPPFALAAPEGTLTIAMHFSPVTRWLSPGLSHRRGPHVDDIMATAIPGFYMSPYEDLKLRAR
ncbi:MAG TPA: hypothetical protein VFR53_12810 [Methylomirabilota bacterium]|nr:hypothetical protein [Methylomirabilota bacterium]